LLWEKSTAGWWLISQANRASSLCLRNIDIVSTHPNSSVFAYFADCLENSAATNKTNEANFSSQRKIMHTREIKNIRFITLSSNKWKKKDQQLLLVVNMFNWNSPVVQFDNNHFIKTSNFIEYPCEKNLSC
jgi:hypothetical protein